MPDSSSIHRLQIAFETLSVPPPYSYQYTFDLQFAEEEFKVQYELKYTNRDELTEEEIWEEGFSNEDDFSWHGQLPQIWNTTLKEAWQKTQLRAADKITDSLENGLVMTAELTGGQQINGVPEKVSEWEYLLQELTQAVYEAAQREHPLRIRYLERSAKGEEIQVIINAHFLYRTFEVIRQQGKKSQQQSLPWSESKALLSTLYQLDFDVSQAINKMPRRPGKYLDPGDSLWYAWKEAVTNPGKKDYLSIIAHFFGKS